MNPADRKQPRRGKSDDAAQRKQPREFLDRTPGKAEGDERTVEEALRNAEQKKKR